MVWSDMGVESARRVFIVSGAVLINMAPSQIFFERIYYGSVRFVCETVPVPGTTVEPSRAPRP